MCLSGGSGEIFFCCFLSLGWVKGGAEGRCWLLSFRVGFGGLHPEFFVESVQLLHGSSLRTVIPTETLSLNILKQNSL